MGTESPEKNALACAPDSPKGLASRTTILLTAARLATTRGLERLSIGDLATEVGMSKSGLYAHFKSKEELELATIEMALQIFDCEVLKPALQAEPGLARLRATVNAFLDHLKRRVFPGGCFFAAVSMELSSRPGPVRDRVKGVLDNWLELLRQCLVDARKKEEIDADADLTQAVFEIQAMLLKANFTLIMDGDKAALSRGRKGVENVIARLASVKK